jgi:hypothetical protein
MGGAAGSCDEVTETVQIAGAVPNETTLPSDSAGCPTFPFSRPESQEMYRGS